MLVNYTFNMKTLTPQQKYVFARFLLEKTGKYAYKIKELDALCKELNVPKLRRKNV